MMLTRAVFLSLLLAAPVQAEKLAKQQTAPVKAGPLEVLRTAPKGKSCF